MNEIGQDENMCVKIKKTYLQTALLQSLLMTPFKNINKLADSQFGF